VDRIPLLVELVKLLAALDEDFGQCEAADNGEDLLKGIAKAQNVRRELLDGAD
jgi:hypothetical protein